jgi:hypothetical protein
VGALSFWAAKGYSALTVGDVDFQAGRNSTEPHFAARDGCITLAQVNVQAGTSVTGQSSRARFVGIAQ